MFSKITEFVYVLMSRQTNDLPNFLMMVMTIMMGNNDEVHHMHKWQPLKEILQAHVINSKMKDFVIDNDGCYRCNSTFQ